MLGGRSALRTPQRWDVEPSTYQGVGRSPWKLLIKSLRRGQLCMGGAFSCVPEDPGSGAGWDPLTRVRLCFWGKRYQGSFFFFETEAGGQSSLGFAGCARIPGGGNSRAPAKCCIFRVSPCSTRERWGSGGAEPALRSFSS